jgi:hypothetical protein
MVDVTFRDLCLDSCDPATTGPFWAEALGLELEMHDDGDADLAGPTKRHTVWINRVPEPQEVKNRVHLDVRFADPAAAPGPVVDDTQDHWTVRADPEGLLYCAFGPREGQAPGAFELVVDAVDPEAIAGWWAARTGTTVNRHESGVYTWLEDVPDMPYAYWVFIKVPEPKTVKNRVHWDVVLRDATVDDLVAAGATVLRLPDDEVRWTVLADPEGNEFCAFTEG